MLDSKCKSLLTLFNDRVEIAYKRLKINPRYLAICERQKRTERIVEELYNERFIREERKTIRRHYEGEIEKNSMDCHECYIQGLKDGFQLVIGLGIITDDAHNNF